MYLLLHIFALFARKFCLNYICFLLNIYAKYSLQNHICISMKMLFVSYLLSIIVWINISEALLVFDKINYFLVDYLRVLTNIVFILWH